MEYVISLFNKLTLNDTILNIPIYLLHIDDITTQIDMAKCEQFFIKLFLTSNIFEKL